MNVEETAAAFDLLPETVKTRLHRARKLLKDALAEHLGPHFSDVFPFDGTLPKQTSAVTTGQKQASQVERRCLGSACS